jgi:hypothetical protein
MDSAQAGEAWDHILTLAKQAVYEHFSDALDYVLKARSVALGLYNTQVPMRGRLLVDLAVLIQLEAEARGIAHDLVEKSVLETTGPS